MGKNVALGSEPGVVWVKWLGPRQTNWNIVWGVLNLPNKNIQKQPVTLHFTWTSSRQPGCIDRNASGCNAALLARSLLAVRCYVKTDLNSNCHKQAKSPFFACWILYELKDETQTYTNLFWLNPHSIIILGRLIVIPNLTSLTEECRMDDKNMWP